MDNSVFISYRREPSDYVATAIFQDLISKGFDVFLDVESLTSGKWSETIFEEIANRPYFLLILDSGSLDRCGDPEDFFRKEIEFAIKQKRQIIPLFFHDYDFEEPQTVPIELIREIKSYNGIAIEHSQFSTSMERLRTKFLVPVEITKIPRTDDSLEVAKGILEKAKEQPPIPIVDGSLWLTDEQKDRVRRSLYASYNTCYNCMPFDEGEIVWISSPTDLGEALHEAFADSGVLEEIEYDPAEYMSELIDELELACPNCSTEWTETFDEVAPDWYEND